MFSRVGFSKAWGPWLVVGLVLVASAGRAAEAIDLSHIPARAVAAVVLSPERLAKTPELELIPWEVVQVSVQQEMGFDPLTVQTAIGFATAPTDDEPPDWGVILRFSQPQPLAGKWLEQTEPATVGQVDYRRARVPLMPSVCQMDPRTLLIGTEPMLREMIATPDVDSPLRQMLRGIPMQNDITVVMAVSPIRDLIKQFTAQAPPLPPPLQGLLELPDQLDTVMIALNLSRERMSGIKLVATDAATAQQVESTLQQGLGFAKQMLLGQMFESMPDVFRAPGSQAPPGKTNYLGIRGDDMALIAPKRAERTPRGSSFRDFTDGLSNTLMIVEANDQSAVEWTRPVDFEPDATQPTKGLVGLRPDGFQALLGDGSVRFISETIDTVTLMRLFTKADGQPIGLD